MISEFQLISHLSSCYQSHASLTETCFRFYYLRPVMISVGITQLCSMCRARDNIIKTTKLLPDVSRIYSRIVSKMLRTKMTHDRAFNGGKILTNRLNIDCNICERKNVTERRFFVSRESKQVDRDNKTSQLCINEQRRSLFMIPSRNSGLIRLCR